MHIGTVQNSLPDMGASIYPFDAFGCAVQFLSSTSIVIGSSGYASSSAAANSVAAQKSEHLHVENPAKLESKNNDNGKEEAKTSPRSTAASKHDSFAEAWNCLDPKKVNHGAILQGLLQDLGLENPGDLTSLESPEILLLSLTMKRPQQKIFLDLIHQEPCPSYVVDHHQPAENYQEAWNHTDGKKVKYLKGFLAAQEELGFSKAEDLRILEGPELALIALTLRKPMQKPFCDALGLKLT